jgi:hypothetical protein
MRLTGREECGCWCSSIGMPDHPHLRPEQCPGGLLQAAVDGAQPGDEQSGAAGVVDGMSHDGQ